MDHRYLNMAFLKKSPKPSEYPSDLKRARDGVTGCWGNSACSCLVMSGSTGRR